MFVPVTYLALAGLVLAAVGIRVLWPLLAARRRRQLFFCLVLLCAPALLNTLTRWDTSNSQVNAALFWTRLFAFELCVVFFTLLRPRALTCLIAVILTLPLFSSSIVGPAGALFVTDKPTLRLIGDNYYLALLPWSSGPQRNGGADFTLFYQPPGHPFLRRSFMGARLYDTQCRTAATTASLDRAAARIAVHCPPLTADPAAPPSGTELDYPIPPGARFLTLAPNEHR